MVDIIIGVAIAVALFLIGSINESWKKLTKIITTLFCKLFGLSEAQLKKEKTLKTSDNFRKYYGDIKKVKKSKENLKLIKSINVVSSIISLIILTLIIINLGSVSGNAISNWLYTWLYWIPLIEGPVEMNTFFTAIMFSILSFSLSKVWSTWVSTKPLRKERKLQKAKKYVFRNTSSKDLVEEAKKKDLEEKEILIKGDK